MIYGSSDYSWEPTDLNIRQHHYYRQSTRPTRRRSTYSRQDQQAFSPTLTRESQFVEPRYFANDESSALFWGPDYLLDDIYMDSIPASPWLLPFEAPPLQQSRRRWRQKGSSTHAYIQPNSYYVGWTSDNEDDEAIDDRRYSNTMMPSHPIPSLTRRRSYMDSSSRPIHHHHHHHRSPHPQLSQKSSRSFMQATASYSPQPSDFEIDDYFGEGDLRYPDQQEQYYNHRHRQSMDTSATTMGHSSPLSRHQHHQAQRPVIQQQWLPRLDQGPVLDTDTQHPLNLYSRPPPIIQPPLFPMLQPMIPAPPSHHHLNYGIPTISNRMPEPFNPMTMPHPTLFPDNTMAPQQSEAAPTTTSTTTENSSSSTPDDTTAKDSSQSGSDLSTPITPTTGNKPENSLVPLVRSLSLGSSSSSSQVKPRRRSLFESLFNLDSKQQPQQQQQQQPPSSRANSISSDSTLIPLNEINTRTLSRKQSLSLEKTAKALSQRSYIWCYRSREEVCWVAMTPKNQISLDPYIGYYHPGASKKGFSATRNLPTLITLDKEPKLAGSFTAMPQAKIARVYPSIFSSANYIELYLDCLPADSQFVVRSD